MGWSDRKPATSELEGARVLVVEDEAIIAIDLECILADAGGGVVGPAATVEEAVALVKSEAISAAVLDVRVGRAKVAPVVRELQARGVPFMFYSGQTDTDAVRTRWPEAAFVAKPAAPSVIVDSVRRLLAAAGPGRAKPAENASAPHQAPPPPAPCA